MTGTSGQIGSIIADRLAEEHVVLGIDLMPGHQTNLRGDIRDRDFIFSAMKDIDAVIHTASLHAPHVPSHTPEEFIANNIKGTSHLLEAAAERQVRRFIYTSTTSLYGHAMAAPDKAVWVTEDLVPEPRDIYDITKIAAENLCKAAAQNYDLACVCLRVSRFFPESEYLMAIYRLYRGVDVRDAAAAHLLALEAEFEDFAVFNISARTPFVHDELGDLYHNAPEVIGRYFPKSEEVFLNRGWHLPQRIDRVYVIEKAEKKLHYHPQYNFASLL